MVSPEDQEKWVSEELGWESVETTRFEYPEQRRKYRGNFERLREHPDFDLICQILQEYIIYTTPFPRKTEYSFWAVSCLPGSGKDILARVNIYWQETLRITNVSQSEIIDGKEHVSSQIDIAVFLSKSVLFRNHPEEYFSTKLKSLEFGKTVYPTGGQDQQAVFITAEEFFAFFDEPDAYEAIRTFNLRLMRKGACNNSRYHCFDLADEMLRTDNMITETSKPG